MSEPKKADLDDSTLSVTLTVGQLKAIVRGEVEKAVGQNGQHGDKLLDAEKASKILSVGEDWLYRHHKKLPFTRKLGSKMLRFSSQGIQKWLATRKGS
ncbi:MAG: hypothetical protein V3T23_03740 [Nitrososphaerales archaeon]